MPRSDKSPRYINPAQVGGIEDYTFTQGPARGVRALCVNTGGGLRYRVLVDRGLDIDQAFMHQHSLAFLTFNDVVAPSRAYDRGGDWLKSFAGGLLTSCGPFNIGKPTTDQGEDLGLHGTHSNTPATIESIVQPDPHRGRLEMSIVATMRYGAFYGPCVSLRRTIRSKLGENVIAITDEFANHGNTTVPHAWLLHINYGYPLVDASAELCVDHGPKIEPMAGSDLSPAFFARRDFKRLTAPRDDRRGDASVVAYLHPRADHNGDTTVGLINRKLRLGVAIHYNTRQFPRLGNWQHLGPGEYVTALEPMNGTVDGRDCDRRRGLLDQLEPGQVKRYEYRIEATTDKKKLDALGALNKRRSAAGS